MIDAACYIRPAGRGLLFGADEPDPPDQRDAGKDGGIEALRLDIRALRPIMDRSGIPALRRRVSPSSEADCRR